ncbi:bifunctional tRNA (5-methylaminomethyl-2-thiouridine)(34)-methyltransferase MnmD/FAD-dependent 5-carboxymethylaminomethyl-2-thiouridine(34) oxidoreductase MnmC [Marinospirillum alkaliphilum]|uniref:tRNA 5-methylaminomethyl-2-thiouridine biosynthesis bifunctional protein MnmC n=1 Tax=Marinospirillum alkaliphilum DSM 21637 TaxID=1122209 RepID=A0A1K1VYN6_9GAMM|nr:bifunctional tRNA (5-methylaminomethyl-2-thiouridine)(34)-methyltransferase MnmD/FAD-dependent 5-carboxymethylaminomethyl-2-thiouridine(34) oxidoreductase MnmC [Marinospirillum alkaliphilum]SFX30321.1 tRNA 5-methylaminomethyl-2-thiouridine biosynthesis bifunctional protein [Marinospirillum alkaliphilum DSM 21637]
MTAQPETTVSCHHPRTLQQARLEWQQATPVAGDFGDVYFSRDQGPDETRHVFLEQNDLPQRWAGWQQKRAFVVGETGFGTGLNLLVAMQVFLQVAPATARLHWVSTELYPLTPDDLQRAHAFWPALAEYAACLQQCYPLPVSGFHRLQLHPRITLDLLLGDAAENLSQLQASVDAWCLDGFAPGKNPGMWTEQLFAALARSSHANTSFATFTSAGTVKRGLQAAGFVIQKVPGFGRKREMLRGHFAADSADQPASTPADNNPLKWNLPPRPTGRLAIIGAGLAGCATAEALSRRGYQADLLEATQPGADGSGNRQGVLYIKLAVDNTPASRFYLAGLEYSRRWLQRLDPQQHFWSDCGVVQLATDEQEAARQQRFLQRQQLPAALVQPLSAEQVSSLAGTPTTHSGLLFSRAGWVKPGALCHQLANHLPGIRLLTSHPVSQLQFDASQNVWRLQTGDQWLEYDTVILAAAYASRLLEPQQWLPVKRIRGQVTHVTLPDTHNRQPGCVICAGGYVSPPADKTLCFGATFNLHSNATELTHEDQQANLAELHQALPKLLTGLGIDADHLPLQGRVGFRCTSPDYLPLTGPAPQHQQWQEVYRDWHKQGLSATPDSPPLHQGLWLHLGHGSRGLASIPLCSELLVSQMLGEPAPLEQALTEAVHPGRFILRALKRNNNGAA